MNETTIDWNKIWIAMQEFGAAAVRIRRVGQSERS